MLEVTVAREKIRIPTKTKIRVSSRYYFVRTAHSILCRTINARKSQRTSPFDVRSSTRHAPVATKKSTQLIILALQLGGWHTVTITVLPSRVTLGIDHQAPIVAVFKATPPPVDLNQPMKVGFMAQKIINIKDLPTKSK